MYIKKLTISDYKALDNIAIEPDGKSVVIFGVNGTGKSSILESINLLYANIINGIVNRKDLKQSYSLKVEDIQYGKSRTDISASFYLNGDVINYHRSMVRKTGRKSHDSANLKTIVSSFHDRYVSEDEQGNIPIFVNYGTNRLVLDIPLRIKTHHIFDIYSAFEKAIENRIDFRTFFEWYRNQEDYENECKIESGDLGYTDLSLDAVRHAIVSMLDDCSNLRVVRKPRLEMKIDKGKTSINVSQMSDGEKCILALFGDLARRLTIANPCRDNPLEGEGVVLIDEIELHMHPSWQRKILKKLKKVFPNIQFIVTTHSPVVLSEVDDNYDLYYIKMEEGKSTAVQMDRLDGYDANMIMEEFMGTPSQNESTTELIHSIYVLINEGRYDKAEENIQKLVRITSENHPDVITARMQIKRRNR